MADDIDDLLNDIERKINAKDARKWDSRTTDGGHSRRAEQPKQNSGCHSSKKDLKQIQHDLDLSDILSDAVEDDIFDPKPLTCSRKNAADGTKRPAVKPMPSSMPNGQKCFSAFIGGSKCPDGLSTAVNTRSCDRLRCTNCDFVVSFFDDFQWSTDTSYLFLRNNMPDFERVRSKLKPKKGSRAYACQCKWLTAVELTELSKTDVKWVCGKH